MSYDQRAHVCSIKVKDQGTYNSKISNLKVFMSRRGTQSIPFRNWILVTNIYKEMTRDSFSLAVINIMTTSNLGGRGLQVYMSPLQLITEGRQDRNFNRSRGKTMKEQCMLTRSLLWALLGSFIHRKTTCSWTAPFTVGQALIQQLLISKMPHKPVLWQYKSFSPILV